MEDSESQVHILSSCEELLRRPDFILEPRCWDTILKYIKAGGKPEQLIESLTDSYVGYAQMASLVCHWNHLADYKAESIDAGAPTASTSESHVKDFDEFHFLKEFVKQKFDSEKLAGVFHQNNGKPPAWIENLTQDPRGRQLIYELSAAHRNSLILNYGIQKILMQGHEDEVASVGSSLASYFSVFHRLLVARLRAIATLCTSSSQSVGTRTASQELQHLAKELADSCAHSLHTYLYAQQLLLWLSQHPGGQVFLRMSQELEHVAAASHPVVWSLLVMLLPPGSHDPCCVFCQVMLLPPGSHEDVVKATGLVSVLLSSSNPGTSLDLSRLADLYHANPELSVSPIQHPQLIKILVTIVFTPGRHGLTDLQQVAMSLLARSTSCSQDCRDQVEDAQRVESTCEAMQAALRIGQHAQGKLVPEDGAHMYMVADNPAACIGLLHYMRHLLSQWDYFHSEAGSQNATPVFVRIAVFIAKKQCALLYLVIDVFESALRALGSQRSELSKIFLDASVVLLRDHGWVPEISDMVNRWSKEADPSLVRYLLHQMLACVCEPYSAPFASWMLRHMTASGIRRVRDGQRGSGQYVALLHEFAASSSKLPFSPPLGPKEASLLQELQQNR
ncbi:hypothetical protein CEUSTIGMA_g9637.t1 [Chlamydomonas eustigma]|uniref:Uncharacterized protein n=1 Tax=Chlamydomonas eustigma TaxID=1157962 RepID=A0A250XH18_9CHLO|nr:hypothetical protein CEUSTIGMA_g9637.t1 [Chlamydomonas eustigma]|eukprot:GAX82209.1 hypothetical protein CEUSTIGMA_g9637.t1 [Chlamydomonas eustigma]